MHGQLGDREVDIALMFDRDTPLSVAKSHATRALTLFSDPVANPPECQSGIAADSEGQHRNSISDRYGKFAGGWIGMLGRMGHCDLM